MNDAKGKLENAASAQVRTALRELLTRMRNSADAGDWDSLRASVRTLVTNIETSPVAVGKEIKEATRVLDIATRTAEQAPATTRRQVDRASKTIEAWIATLPTTQPSSDAANEVAQRRQARVRELFELFIDQQGLPHEKDEHGVLQVQLPKYFGTSAHTHWHVAFDRKTATERLAEPISFTNPRFQQIKRELDNRPVLCYRLVQRLDEPPLQEGRWHTNVLRTDFSFHLTYKTYAQTREELYATSVGVEDFGEALVTDAYHQTPVALPPAVRLHFQTAQQRVAAHLQARVAQFSAIAAAKMETEKERLGRYKTNEEMSYWSQAVTQDNEFYAHAIEQRRAALGRKYEVTVTARLLSVEPYFGTGASS